MSQAAQQQSIELSTTQASETEKIVSQSSAMDASSTNPLEQPKPDLNAANPNVKTTGSTETAAGVGKTEAGPSTTDTPTIGGNDNSPDSQTLRIKIMNATGNPSHNQYIFTITPPYLRKREVVVKNGDPFELTIAQVKELIWRDWPPFAASSKPESPTDIRLIHFGMYLIDEQTLKDTRFSRGNMNVVHMVIRPRTLVDPNEIKSQALGGAGAGNTANSNDEERNTSSGCACCVIL